jgi:hypothetical protein
LTSLYLSELNFQSDERQEDVWTVKLEKCGAQLNLMYVSFQAFLCLKRLKQTTDTYD